MTKVARALRWMNRGLHEGDRGGRQQADPGRGGPGHRGRGDDGDAADRDDGRLPYTGLREAVFAHPTLAESLNNLFAHFES